LHAYRICLLFGTLTVWQFDHLAVWQQHDTCSHLLAQATRSDTAGFEPLTCVCVLLLREDGLLTNSSALYNGYGLGDDWFEGALLRPDLVLSDVARAINSSNVPQASSASSGSFLLLCTDMTKRESQDQNLQSAVKTWLWISSVRSMNAVLPESLLHLVSLQAMRLTRMTKGLSLPSGDVHTFPQTQAVLSLQLTAESNMYAYCSSIQACLYSPHILHPNNCSA